MKKISAIYATFLICLISFGAGASSQQLELKTPRGVTIKIDTYNVGLRKALVLAPGQGCNARLDMYDAIASEAQKNNFTVVRLYWAYCLIAPTGNPSENLSNEKEDFLTALSYVKNTLGYANLNLYVGGKSLGSFVSSDVFMAQKNLQGLLMLTPICTDSQTDPKSHKNIFAESYPRLESEARLILFGHGSADPLCDNDHFFEYLEDKGNNFVPMVIKADHSLGVKNQDGQYNMELGARNLKTISKWIFTWLE